MNTEERKLLTSKEVCEKLRISQSMFYRMASDRTLPVVRIHKAIRVWSDELDRYLERCSTDGGAR